MKHAASLTHGSIWRGLIRFTLPIICANVLQSLNGSINSIWVGHYLGEVALTATLNANLVMGLLTGSGLGIATAAAILVGQHIGARDLDGVKRIVGTSVTFFAAVALCLSVAGISASEPLLKIIGTPPGSLSLATSYMRVTFLGFPFLFEYVLVTSLLNSVGDSRTPFYFLMLTVGIDTCLNPLFILGASPVPRMGVSGSALATCVAYGASLGALVIHLYKRKHMLRIDRDELDELRMKSSIVAALISKGVPAGAQILVSTWSNLLVISLVNRFGVETTAAFAASNQLCSYVYIPMIALGVATSSMAAQNLGAQNWDRVNSIARAGVLYCILVTLLVFGLLQSFSREASGLFLPAGSQALSISIHINRIVLWSPVPFGVATVLLGIVSANGSVIAALIIQVVSFIIIRIPLANFLFDRWSADGIWWSFPITNLFVMVLTVTYYKYGAWRKGRNLIRGESTRV